MKFKAILLTLALAAGTHASAQFNIGRAAQAIGKTAQAITLTDAQMADYVKESVDWMDKNNPVAAADDPYAIRLTRLTEGLTNADGIPLNFKVYKVIDINAFACPDGSVRVFSSLMDMMSDDELLGIIGHEIGHVACHHSKKQFKQTLLTSAAKDAIAATSNKVAALTDSQLGELSTSLMGASYSRKQETEADDFGYDFLKQNGKNPWAMVLAFEKMQQLEAQGGTPSRLTKMFSSHPDTKARIENMTKRAQKDKIARPEAK
ncbi:MAG: M48 family metallopeptidase [Duncaniella sp.]|nr:M48 family metallopeptidase [Duncaniella sp.]